ncbi:MAG TPA: CHAT domain-containing tetratricopeptide repeat protein, partial [Thermoanaerobaculia bacterium]|nr:CHAT domain-containing tetratricopeptide repeat protein [Thermoanaerobaculia bacterium]
MIGRTTSRFVLVAVLVIGAALLLAVTGAPATAQTSDQAPRPTAAERVRALAAEAAELVDLDLRLEAGELFEQAVAAAENAELSAAETVDLYLDAGAIWARLSRFAQTREVLARAEAALGQEDDPLRRARVLNLRGSLESYRGNAAAARDARSEAVGVLETAGEREQLGRALYDLAQSLIALHDYAAAVKELRRALELLSDDRIRRYSRISLGIAQFELNQVDDAEATFLEVMRDAEAAGDRAGVGWASGELGLVARDRGDYESALAWCDRAIAISREMGDHRNVVAWMSNKGTTLRDMGRHGEALEQYRRLRELDEGIETLWLQRSLHKMEAQSWAALGEDDRAEPLFRRAVRLATAAGDRKLVWESELELARLHRRAGASEEALASYERALDAIEQVRGTLQLESFKRDFLRNKVGVYAEAIDLVTAEPGLGGPGRGFEIAERARARAFLDTLAESRAELEETLPAEYGDRERDLLDRISELQARARRGEVDPAIDLDAENRRLEDELEALQLEVRERFPRFQGMRSTEVVTIEQVQSELAPGEVLLAYFVAEPQSHLWAIEAGRVEHWRIAGTAEIEAAIRVAFGELLRHDSEPRLEALGTELLGSWTTEAGEEPRSILVVASGPLHFVPFEALPLGDGRLLADLAPSSYAPSATTWIELRRRPVELEAPLLLALGDAVSGDDIDRLRAVGDLRALETLGALPHSRTEVESVARVFGRSASTVLLGAEATEARFEAAVPGRAVVHLATHGWIDPATPSASGLVLGAGEGDGDDGILQLREIVRLDLAADLVTLSACESALGELVTGEGMVGLARSFFYAGADSVLATLWSVDDATSARFMTAFYRALRSGVSKAEALRRARAEIRSDPATAHPYYWAPYVLLGRGDDGVAMPARGLPGWGIALALVAGLGL